MLENIGAGILFIIWLPLTIAIFMKMKEGKTVVSFDGVNGYLSAYLSIFVRHHQNVWVKSHHLRQPHIPMANEHRYRNSGA